MPYLIYNNFNGLKNYSIYKKGRFFTERISDFLAYHFDIIGNDISEEKIFGNEKNIRR
jgi:hypothetical protein